MRTYALLAALALLPLVPSEALAVTAGVTAAVNQNARSIPPGGGIRTIVLGDNVIQDETIETDGAGLVQILLADGTTFTVGPNSSLVIDRFVYDPSANTAQVAASLGRGVFRFIGGRTSKTEGGVQLNTPVGTVGIRGGMADLNFSGTGGNIAQIDLLFGNEVTLNGPGGGDRLFQAGYSIIIGPNGQPSVIKTPPGSANIIQQALAGRPGANGGNSQQPSDDDVEESGVTENNSDTTPPQDIPPPDLDAIDLATPNPNDINQVAQNLNKVAKTMRGFSAGMFGSESLPAGYLAAPLYDFNGDTRVQFGNRGNVVGAKFVSGLTDSGSTSVTFEEGKATLLTGTYPGSENFSIYVDDQPTYSADDVFTVVTRSHATLYDGNDELEPVATNCDCFEWGYWTSAFDYEVPDSGVLAIDLNGYWIAGDIITPEQYESLYMAPPTATASYSGSARGFVQVLESAAPNASDLVEGVGTFNMTWNFGDEDGTFHLDFGSSNYLVQASTDIDRQSMEGGYFASIGMTTGADHLGVTGAFINDGNEIADGVIGNFNIVDTTVGGDIITATGIFASENVPYGQ